MRESTAGRGRGDPGRREGSARGRGPERAFGYFDYELYRLLDATPEGHWRQGVSLVDVLAVTLANGLVLAAALVPATRALRRNES